MKSAIRYAVVMLLLAAGLGVALVYAALYLPENYMLRLEKPNSKLTALLPPVNDLAPEMILIHEAKNTNESVADHYEDPKAMLALLDEFGRQEGASQTYAAPERCRTEGARSVYLSVVEMRNAEGARAYSDWLRAREFQQDGQVQTKIYHPRSNIDTMQRFA